MSKTNPVAEAMAAFARTMGLEPGGAPPAKSSEPRQRRRSVTPRPSDGLMSVKEVSARLGVSTDTVIRRFAGLPGVIDVSRPGTRRKRRYRTLRIPPETLRQFLKNKAGRGK